MNALAIEHMPLADLPPAWRARLDQTPGTMVTVRIEEEAQVAPPEPFETDDPLFRMWRDREDTADPAGYVRPMRAFRFNDHSIKCTDCWRQC